MGSLRVRLVLGLLILAALGLLLVGGVTYAEQRSFLFTRIDQQAQSATAVVSRALDQAGFAGGPSESGPPGRVPGDHGGGPRGGGADATANLPPGTYGQRRTAAGQVMGHIILSYGETPLPAPRIPAGLAPGQLVTVDSVTGAGPRYRVLAERDMDNTAMTVVAVPLREVDQTLHRLLAVEAIVIGGVLLALGLLAWLVVRLGLRPLDRMERTAEAIAAGDLSRRVSPATPRTEIGRLGLALNTMLERLQQAFTAREASEQRLRQFLADASHELRTPLASIRGYAELFRMGAAADPQDTRKAMRRIEDEAARMGILVEDLLTLARLDAVRETVHEPVELFPLARDAVDAARVRAPQREITLHGDPSATVHGDPHQLRQVLDNLLRNAIVHTPEGTPVDVRVGRDPDGCRLEVRDHGPGLPPGDPQGLFERFWRAEAGRERGKGGAGLGLAIVAAIADAHGGAVTAENAPDGGARFVVSLPISDSR
jgi:two-component system OmpR family sensor kinase